MFLKASFNPRARVGRDVPSSFYRIRRWSFNPRARVGRDTLCPRCEEREEKFQSTRPRGARLKAQTMQQAERPVSIHAPAWGATSQWRIRSWQALRFNPRARVGRDRNTHPCSASNSRFNPRARVGRDTRERRRMKWQRGFNPRARVGRDTPSRRSRIWQSPFQSTRPRGARPSVMAAQQHLHRFQSTRPRGARPAAATLANQPRKGFNPRARVGRDVPPIVQVALTTLVSIHAPAWGATS